MDDREAGRYWERNAHAWTILSRQGWDVYRDALNTPAFLALLPDVTNKKGLDIGCGEGHNTRLLAERGARMFGLDISPAFIRYAAEEGRGIAYVVGTALELPFASAEFDFVTAIMALMDLPDERLALAECYRVLRPGGFLQFSITHPCFSPPYRRLLRTPQGHAYAVEVGQYFDRVDGRVTQWLFSAAPAEAKAGLKQFETPTFHRTLSEWMNAVLQAGFRVERVAEPRAGDETVRAYPAVQDTQVVAYFLHLRCRKPE